MGRRLLGTKGYDELAARRTAEIDDVIEEIAQLSRQKSPTRIDVLFERLFLAYVLLRARDGGSVAIVLGQQTYERAKASGLLAWYHQNRPNVSFTPPNAQVRGPSNHLVILDEITAIPDSEYPDEIVRLP